MPAPPTDRAAKAREARSLKMAAQRAAEPAELNKAILTVKAAVIRDPEVYRILDGILAARRRGGGSDDNRAA